MVILLQLNFCSSLGIQMGIYDKHWRFSHHHHIELQSSAAQSLFLAPSLREISSDCACLKIHTHILQILSPLGCILYVWDIKHIFFFLFFFFRPLSQIPVTNVLLPRNSNLHCCRNGLLLGIIDSMCALVCQTGQVVIKTQGFARAGIPYGDYQRHAMRFLVFHISL